MSNNYYGYTHGEQEGNCQKAFSGLFEDMLTLVAYVLSLKVVFHNLVMLVVGRVMFSSRLAFFLLVVIFRWFSFLMDHTIRLYSCNN